LNFHVILARNHELQIVFNDQLIQNTVSRFNGYVEKINAIALENFVVRLQLLHELRIDSFYENSLRKMIISVLVELGGFQLLT
jgi:hypothetical protein